MESGQTISQFALLKINLTCVLSQILLVHEASKGSFSRVFDFEANDVKEDETNARTR